MNNRHTLLLLALVTGFFFSVPYAQAEVFSIQGKNADIGIFIFIEDRDNIMKIYTEKGDVEFYDSKIKLYKSGGFSIKNYGVGVWGHPISDSQYDLVIMTSEGVQRITASTNEVRNVEEKPQRIEPKSSVGADITKWNIPTDTSRNTDPGQRLTLKYNALELIEINGAYAPNIRTYNELNPSERFEGVDVNIKITRDNVLIKELSGTTNKAGQWNPEINISYPTFYPTFCYDVVFTAQLGNQTKILTDDFQVWTRASYWTENVDVVPETIYTDYKCND